MEEENDASFSSRAHTLVKCSSQGRSEMKNDQNDVEDMRIRILKHGHNWTKVGQGGYPIYQV